MSVLFDLPDPYRKMLGKQSFSIARPLPKIEAVPVISATRRINGGELLHLVGSGTELGEKFLRNRITVRFADGTYGPFLDDKLCEMYAWLEQNTTGLFSETLEDARDGHAVICFETEADLIHFKLMFEGKA